MADYYMMPEVTPSGDPLGNGDLWWLGAIIYTVGSIIINLGSNLIRMNHDRLSRIPVHLHPPWYQRWPWLLGMLLLVLFVVVGCW
jgi:hypothetical protein